MQNLYAAQRLEQNGRLGELFETIQESDSSTLSERDLDNFNSLDCDLAKTLLLVALLHDRDMLSKSETFTSKRFILSVKDTAVLAHMLSSFEKSLYTLLVFRRSLAGFMGAPNLGQIVDQRKS